MSFIGKKINKFNKFKRIGLSVVVGSTTVGCATPIMFVIITLSQELNNQYIKKFGSKGIAITRSCFKSFLSNNGA